MNERTQRRHEWVKGKVTRFGWTILIYAISMISHQDMGLLMKDARTTYSEVHAEYVILPILAATSLTFVISQQNHEKFWSLGVSDIVNGAAARRETF